MAKRSTSWSFQGGRVLLALRENSNVPTEILDLSTEGSTWQTCKLAFLQWTHPHTIIVWTQYLNNIPFSCCSARRHGRAGGGWRVQLLLRDFGHGSHHWLLHAKLQGLHVPGDMCNRQLLQLWKNQHWIQESILASHHGRPPGLGINMSRNLSASPWWPKQKSENESFKPNWKKSRITFLFKNWLCTRPWIWKKPR